MSQYQPPSGQVDPLQLSPTLDATLALGQHRSDTLLPDLPAVQEERTSADRTRTRILAAITAREEEFLKLVCRSDEPTYENIADAMGVHRRTVDGYRESLFGKFGIKSKVGLVLFAVRWGVVRL